MVTLLAASFDQGIESFHCSVRMRRATSRRNALTSLPVSAASDTYHTNHYLEYVGVNLYSVQS